MRCAALLPAFSFLTACGGIGLDPMVLGVGANFAPIDAELLGRTYAASVADMEVLYPSQFAMLLGAVGDRELLFHVAEEKAETLQIVAAIANEQGQQNLCDAAVPMPIASWWDNPEFRISGADWTLPVGGNMVTLSDMSLEGTVVDEGQTWDRLVMITTIDTREWSADLDFCASGVECIPCADGHVSCMELGLEMKAYQVDISFDPHASGYDGC